MVRWKLKELIGEYQQKTGETLRHVEISRATGISQNTLSLLANNKTISLHQRTMDSLLKYFEEKLKRRLTLNDLAVYESSAPTAPAKRKKKGEQPCT